MQNRRDDGKTISATEVRAGRIVKRGAIRRVLWVSLALAIGALMVVYLLFST